MEIGHQRFQIQKCLPLCRRAVGVGAVKTGEGAQRTGEAGVIIRRSLEEDTLPVMMMVKVLEEEGMLMKMILILKLLILLKLLLH